MTINNSRLVLVPMTAALVAREMNDRKTFGDQLQAEIPPTWPPEQLADALPWFAEQLRANPTWEGWLGWYGLWQRPGESGAVHPVLVSSGGFLGPPQSETGTVEIGYSVLPEFQGQGFVTEMMEALIGWALTQPGVQRITAETGRSNTASQRVLQKLGFAPVGAGREPYDVRFEQVSPSPLSSD